MAGSIRAQTGPLIDVSAKIEKSAANEKSTLNRQTRVLTSSADVTLKNISSEPIAGPFHAAIILNSANAAAVQVPGALGGLGQAPYQTFYFDLTSKLSGGVLPAGGSITFTLTLVRASTVPVSYDVRSFAGQEGGPLRDGALEGAVFDDSIGQPITEANIEVLLDEAPAAGPLAKIGRAPDRTDDNGKFFKIRSSGNVRLKFSKDGFSSVWRELTLVGDIVTHVFNARLTPLSPPQPIDNQTGGAIGADNNRATLFAHPGTFGGSAEVSLTKIGGQGLPGLLPGGWSPMSAWNVGPEFLTFNSPVELRVTGADNLGGEPTPNQLVAAIWDPEQFKWVRIEMSPGETGGVLVKLNSPGTAVFVLPDQQPASPAIPDIGQPLAGVATGAIPNGAALQIEPSPEVLFAQPGALSRVQAGLENTPALPSGTPVQVDFNESYERIDDLQLLPPAMLQDFVLYRNGANFTAQFNVTPSREFDPTLLRQGIISLRAHRMKNGEGTALIGSAGGEVQGLDGSTIEIPAGALAETTPVLLDSTKIPDALTSKTQFTPFAGIIIDLGDAPLGVGGQWTFTLPAAPASDAQFLAVREVEIQSITRYALVAVGEVNGSIVTAGPGSLGLPLPGITESGRYFLVRMNEPVGFVTGHVLGASGTPRAMVSINTLDFVGLTNATAQYAVAGLISQQTLDALELENGAAATANATIDSANQQVPLNLQLAAARPTVLTLLPADGAENVPQVGSIQVTFSRPMDPQKVNGATFQVRQNNNAVNGSVSLQADGLKAIFQPAAPLAAEASHQVFLAPSIADTFGNLLFGNQPDGSFVSFFKTTDVTPPPAPEPGQIHMGLPDEDGIVTLTGAPGTAAPGTIVTILNNTTGGSTTVIAGADGSFIIRFVADISHALTLELRDPAGNVTSISPGLFDGGNGEAVVGQAGGTVTLPDGSTFTFEEGSFAQPTQITIETFGADENPIPPLTEAGLEFAAGLRIDTHGRELLKPLKFRIQHPGPLPTDRELLVARLEENNGEPFLVLVESANYVDGAIQVNSPPFPGVFGFMAAASPIVIFIPALATNVSFVSGEVIKAPPVGSLKITVPKEAKLNDGVAVSAVAEAIPPGAQVVNVSIEREDGTHLASSSTGHVVTADVINEDLIDTVASFIKFIFLGQQKVTWVARASINANGKNFQLEARASTEILVTGTPGNEKREGADHEFDRVTAGASEPAVGAYIRIFNGLANSYPIVTQTNKLGLFVLAASTGPGFLQVFDPLTGQGVEFPINVPTIVFDFLDIGTLFVPQGFGDGLPPTLDIGVTGAMRPNVPITINLTASDNDKLASIKLTVQGQTEFENATLSGATFTRAQQYTPTAPGELTIEALVRDNSGNESRRSAIVRITDPAAAGAGAQPSGGGVTLTDGSTNMPLDAAFYVPLAQVVHDNFAIEDLAGVDISFLEQTSGQRIPATGGIAAGGEFLRVRPRFPLPPNTEMRLDIGGGNSIKFTTRGLVSGGVLGGFKAIRGIAQFGRYAYVADFTTDGDSVKIVDLVDPANPVIVGGFPFPGGARGIAVDSDQLAVVGGGGSELPILRLYRLTDPLKPERTANCILFPLADQAIPTTVELSGDLAYVGLIGAGVQTINLEYLRAISATPISERVGEEKTGAAAIIGGFRLPNPETNPPLVGSPFDIDIRLSGLALTAGSSNRLFILSNTAGGFLGPVPLVSGQLWYDLPAGAQRLAASSDFLVRGDFNGDGIEDFSNKQLVAVSHGAAGLSLHDLSSPIAPTLLKHLATPDPIFEMEILEGFIFTANRVLTVFDPDKPLISKTLEKTQATGFPTPFTAGADLSISEAFPIETTGERIVLMASSSADRTKLQTGFLVIPERGLDWDIIRTGPLEPKINPDNMDVLNSGDPVNPFNGELMQQEVDMAVQGRGALDFAFMRTYRSRNNFNGPIGFGWDHVYNDRLTVKPVTDLGAGATALIFRSAGANFTTLEYGDVIRYDGTGRTDTFTKNQSGYIPPQGTFGELKQLTDDISDYFELQLEDGSLRTYRPTHAAPWMHFRLESIEDVHGNIMRFKYNLRDQLVTIRDSMGRDFTLTYDSGGHIVALTDYADRIVRYEYDFDDNLSRVAEPVTNDFPDGRTTTYDYSGGFFEFSSTGELLESAELNHNLKRITDPNGVTYLQVEYYPATSSSDINFDRVKKQTFGEPSGGGGRPPSGGNYEFIYSNGEARTINRDGDQTIRTYDADGHLTLLTEDAIVRGVATTINSRMQYNGDGQLTKFTAPNGQVTDMTYLGGASPLRKGDLKQVTITPAGGGTARTWKFTPGPFGTPTRIEDPANIAVDYTVDAKGKIQQVIFPSVTQADGTHQQLTRSFNYGGHGEVLSITDTDGTITRIAYFGNSDPNGDGDSSETIPAVIDNELPPGPGYVRTLTADASVGGVQLKPGPTGSNLQSPGNLKQEFKYDAVGNRVSVKDPRGVTTTMKVNENNMVEEVTDPRGTRFFKFDGNGSIIQTIGLAGRIAEMKYDALGQLVETEESGPGVAARTTRFVYTANEFLAQSISPLGYKTVMAYDPQGSVIEERTEGGSPNPVTGLAWKLQYDEVGNHLRRENAEGDAWVYAYNGFNEMIRSTDPNGNKVEIDYDARGLVVKMRSMNAQGIVLHEIVNDIDALGRVRKVSESGGGTGKTPQTSEVKFVFDDGNRITKTIDPLGRVTEMKYDGLGRITLLRDALGNETEHKYVGADLDLVTERRNQPGGVTRTRILKPTFDTFGRLTQSIVGFGTPDQRVRSYTYDARDNLLKLTESGGIAIDFTYDTFNRMTRRDTGAYVERMTYDAQDRLLTHFDASGRGLTFEYDGRNRTVSRTYANGSKETIDYFADDMVKSITDRAGNVMNYTHDDANRLTQVDVAAATGFGGSTRRSFGYDGLNRMTNAASLSPAGTWSISNSFDELSNLLSQQQQGNLVQSGFNLASERTNLTFANNIGLAMKRTATGMLSGLELTGQPLLTMQYLGSDLGIQATYGNGTTAESQFNGAMEEINRAYRSPQSALLTGYAVRRDGSGRTAAVSFLHQGGAGDTFGYTPEGWLDTHRTGVADPLATPQGAAAHAFDWNHDASGNWLSLVEDGATRAITSNNLNQLTNDGLRTYQYDANGNLVSDGVRNYQYSAFGELVRVTEVAGGAEVARYRYDALGRRVERVAGGVTERYVYDGPHLIQVLNGQNQTERLYVHGDEIDRPVMLRTPAGDFYYQFDHRGCIAALTDSTGSIAERYEFDAFGRATILSPGGQPRAASAIGNDLMFAGRPVDPATGIVYMRDRDYLPALGRFLQPDPLRAIDGPNVYTYAANDPINYADPTGLYRRAIAPNMRTGHILGQSMVSWLQLAGAVLQVSNVGRGLNGRYLPSLNKFMKTTDELNAFWKVSLRSVAGTELRSLGKAATGAAAKDADYIGVAGSSGRYTSAAAMDRAAKNSPPWAASRAAGRAIEPSMYSHIDDAPLVAATETLLKNELRPGFQLAIRETQRTGKEQGGTIFRRPDNTYYIIAAAEGKGESIPLKNFHLKGMADADEMIGMFHTHPSSSPPSPGDLIAFAQGSAGKTHFVLSEKSIYLLELERKGHTFSTVWHRLYDTSVLSMGKF